MKKLAVFAYFISIFFLVAAGLSAQIPRESRFYIQSISGAGSREAKDFIQERIAYEIVLHDYLLYRVRFNSDYVIRGIILPITEGAQLVKPRKFKKTSKYNQEFLSLEFQNTIRFNGASNIYRLSDLDQESVIVLQLLNRNNDVLDEGLVAFKDLNDEVTREISLIMAGFFKFGLPKDFSDVEYIQPHIAQRPPKFETASEPEEEEEAERVSSDDWRDKLIYFELGYLWAPRENVVKDKMNYLNVGVNFTLEVQFLKFLALEAGAQFIQETSGGEENRDVLVEFPVALKFLLKPLKNFMISPYGGVSFNYFSFNDNVSSSKFAYFGGVEFCMKTNSGIIVIEPRVARDKDYTNLGSAGDYKRTLFQLGLGYKIGLISKKVVKQSE